MKKMSSTSLWCFTRNAAPIAMAAALALTTACAHQSNAVPPEKAYGTGIGAISDPAKIQDNGTSSTSSMASSNRGTASSRVDTYSSTNSSQQTVVKSGTPTTTSATTVRSVPLPNSSFPCESVTASTRPASAITFYTYDPVSGAYLPAGTMASAPSGSTSYYTYDTTNGWYTVSTSSLSGGTPIFIYDQSGTRMVPAGSAVITTRPCGSAYVVTTTTTTSTPVHVQTTTTNNPQPQAMNEPMTSSSTVYTGPTIYRPYRSGRSSASIDLFATRLQFRNSDNNAMFINGVPTTGGINTSFQRENGWGLALNGRLARMAELSVGASYIKPNVNYTPAIGSFGTLRGNDLTVIPAFATLNFHLLPESFIDPYIGGGASYMHFSGSQNFNVATPVAGGTVLQSVSYKNAWGWHADGGVLFSFGHNFGINANAKYMDVRPETRATFLNSDGMTTVGTFGGNSKLKMTPWQFSVGLRFGF